MPRPSVIEIGLKKIEIPIFFPSISSIKTTLSVESYLQAIKSLKNINNQFLISAFDITYYENNNKIKYIMDILFNSNMTILIDSGNYESFWKMQQKKWTPNEFHKILSNYKYSFAFMFDEQMPPHDIDTHIELIIKQWTADEKISRSNKIIPIIHEYPNHLPLLCFLVSKYTGTSMIAIAERRLGDGIFERAKTVQSIRSKLNELDHYVALHLLGTGDPLSIFLYSIMGADSFDGLEWCKNIIDYNTGLVYASSYADLLLSQSRWNNYNLSFQAKIFAHNLEFYSIWMHNIRKSILENTVKNFLTTYTQCQYTEKIIDFLYEQGYSND